METLFTFSYTIVNLTVKVIYNRLLELTKMNIKMKMFTMYFGYLSIRYSIIYTE